VGSAQRMLVSVTPNRAHVYLGVGLSLSLAACSKESAPPQEVAAASAHPISADCAPCHAAQTAAWSSSHHAHASGTSLHPERFDGRMRTFGGLRVTPEVRGEEAVFRVRDGAGERVWEVTGTIGLEPLQQYLLRDGGGRFVVAPVAWDTAGERWFDPAPNGASADPKAPLYWAGMAGNWNHLCGECHTTRYEKAYDPVAGAYASTFQHPAVACEACHGSGARVLGLREPATQTRACIPCHSRHQTLAYGGSPTSELLDTIRPALIGHVVFEADGRNFAPEEPFEWGAYSQSVMSAAGVRCSDCHDPHTGRPRAEGDAVCTGCHAGVALRHPPRTETSACIACHMPTRTYMGIHRRHDHGMHAPGPTRLGPTWTAAIAGSPSAGPALLALAQDPKRTSFVRASAIAALRGQRPVGALELRALLTDPDSLIRLEATETLASWGLVPVSSLADRAKAVRLSAFQAIVGAGAPAAMRTKAFDAVRRELEATTRIHGDLPATWQNVGAMREVLGDAAGALAAYETAIRLGANDPWLEDHARALRREK
jgi:hypothetical protein